MTQTWHADEETLRAWADGSAAPVPAASLEAHLLRCDECRRRMATLAPSASGSDVVRRWDALADRIDRPRVQPAAAPRPGHPRAAHRLARLDPVLLVPAGRRVRPAGLRRCPSFMALAPRRPAGGGGPRLRTPRRAGRRARPRHARPPACAWRPPAPCWSPSRRCPIGVGGGPAARAPQRPVALGWLLPGAALALAGVLWPARPGSIPRSSPRPWARAGPSPSRWPAALAPGARRRRHRRRRLGSQPAARPRRRRRRRCHSPSPAATPSPTGGPHDHHRHRRPPPRITPLRAAGLTKRFGPRSPSTRSTWRSGAASWDCSAPTAPARRRCCASWPPCSLPTEGRCRCWASTRPSRPARTRSGAGWATCPQSPRLYGGFTPLEMVDYVAILKEHTDAARRRREAVPCSRPSASATRCTSASARCRAACSSASPWPQRSSAPQTSSCSTSRPPGLDPEQRIALRSVLAESAHRGRVLLSTHNTAEVGALCQQVLVMDRGTHLLVRHARRARRGEAEGRVWESATSRSPPPCARWPTGPGTRRHVGTPPDGRRTCRPTLDDGYLLVTRLRR